MMTPQPPSSILVAAHHPALPLEPTKVDGKTSKLCPHCLSHRVRSSRARSYDRSEPFERHQLNPRIPIHKPRFSADNPFWNAVLVFLLIAPSEGSPWFECWAHASCPKCKIKERVHELDYARQFGRLRLFLFWVKAQVRRLLDLIIPEN